MATPLKRRGFLGSGAAVLALLAARPAETQGKNRKKKCRRRQPPTLGGDPDCLLTCQSDFAECLGSCVTNASCNDGGPPPICSALLAILKDCQKKCVTTVESCNQGC